MVLQSVDNFVLLLCMIFFSPCIALHFGICGSIDLVQSRENNTHNEQKNLPETSFIITFIYLNYIYCVQMQFGLLKQLIARVLHLIRQRFLSNFVYFLTLSFVHHQINILLIWKRDSLLLWQQQKFSSDLCLELSLCVCAIGRECILAYRWKDLPKRIPPLVVWQ